MNDATYRMLVGLLDVCLWGGDLIGRENLPQCGPAVFIANHLGPRGPISAVCALPLRMHLWIRAEMLDREKAPAYLNQDFVERTLKLKPPLSMAFARLLSKITVPLLTSLETIPAYQSYEDLRGALKISTDLLNQGKCVLVYPEDNTLPVDPVTKMSPFKKGFTRLGELFFAESGQCLAFYPITVLETYKAIVGKPVVFNPKFQVAQERLRIKNILEDNIRRTYIAASMERVFDAAY